MTEEDTFRRLRRTPFQDMRLIVRDANRRNVDKRAIIKQLIFAGWSVLEYNQHLAREVKNEHPQLR